MKTSISTKEGLLLGRSPHFPTIRSLFLGTLLLVGTQMNVNAQENQLTPIEQTNQIAVDTQRVVAQEVQYTRPTWRFGVAGGANGSFYRGSTQQLNSFVALAAFHRGFGVGLYATPLIEVQNPDSRWGFMFQAGYDNRKGAFEEVVSPCNCPADLNTNLSYITVEPSLRFAPFKSDFYLFGGPRFAYNIDKSFNFEQRINPEFPNQDDAHYVIGDFSEIKNTIISMQIGAGYDIQLSSPERKTKAILSPFISFQPYFGQDPRSIESWNMTTLRVGAALKFGRGKKIEPLVELIPEPVEAKVTVVPEVKFSVSSPENIVVERRVRETFPIRNYVFFNSGSTKIPDRYILLKKHQVKDFKEEQLGVTEEMSLSGRSDRQMTVYYNVLNILGDRMVKNPSANVRLTGASMKGDKDGLEMAGSVKKYLVDVFGIEPSRITTEGRVKPRIPSEQPGGTKDLDLLREGDHRVSIWSESPAMMMEFQSGPDAPLKPVEFVTVQKAPVDSYVSIDVEGAKKAFTSWSLEIKDDKGTVQNFGPYTKETENLPGKSILGTRPEGDYKVTMIGTTEDGSIVKKDTTVHMVLWTPVKTEEGMRFSVIYEFNESESSALYEKYLTDIVAPKITSGAKVVIHGYTDIIGDEAYNKTLSTARANDVKTIIESALAKGNRTNVKIETYGFGEDENVSPFDNKYPEERFYNRTVIIDIIPK